MDYMVHKDTNYTYSINPPSSQMSDAKSMGQEQALNMINNILKNIMLKLPRR